MNRFLGLTLLLQILFSLSACLPGAVSSISEKRKVFSGLIDDGSPGAATKKNITVSWNRNHAKSVNTIGGGYRVYYSSSSVINGSTSFIDVPYVSGEATPVTAKLPALSAGSYFVSVVAYSAKNPIGSSPVQTTLVVPTSSENKKN
jgi:hypothetical protein